MSYYRIATPIHQPRWRVWKIEATIRQLPADDLHSVAPCGNATGEPHNGIEPFLVPYEGTVTP